MFLSALFHVVGYCKFLLCLVVQINDTSDSGEVDQDWNNCHRMYVPFLIASNCPLIAPFSQKSSMGLVRVRRLGLVGDSLASAYPPKFLHHLLARSLDRVFHVRRGCWCLFPANTCIASDVPVFSL